MFLSKFKEIYCLLNASNVTMITNIIHFGGSSNSSILHIGPLYLLLFRLILYIFLYISLYIFLVNRIEVIKSLKSLVFISVLYYE